MTTGAHKTALIIGASSPMRVVERLQGLVPPQGTIGIMSSGQGSVANNDKGGFEIYRASKSALNQLMRSFAAQHVDDERTFLLMAPGWVQTDLGARRRPHYRPKHSRRGRHNRGERRLGWAALPRLPGQHRCMVTAACQPRPIKPLDLVISKPPPP